MGVKHGNHGNHYVRATPTKSYCKSRVVLKWIKRINTLARLPRSPTPWLRWDLGTGQRPPFQDMGVVLGTRDKITTFIGNSGMWIHISFGPPLSTVKTMLDPVRICQNLSDQPWTAVFMSVPFRTGMTWICGDPAHVFWYIWRLPILRLCWIPAIWVTFPLAHPPTFLFKAIKIALRWSIGREREDLWKKMPNLGSASRIALLGPRRTSSSWLLFGDSHKSTRWNRDRVDTWTF